MFLHRSRKSTMPHALVGFEKISSKISLKVFSSLETFGLDISCFFLIVLVLEYHKPKFSFRISQTGYWIEGSQIL